MVRDYAPEVQLIVRVNRTPNTERIYRSGADFAISVGQVAGQILAYHLLDEQVIPVENRIKISRLTPARWSARIRGAAKHSNVPAPKSSRLNEARTYWSNSPTTLPSAPTIPCLSAEQSAASNTITASFRWKT